MIKTKPILLELAIIMALSFFILATDYFVFEKNTIFRAIQTHQQYHTTIQALHDKKNRVSAEKNNLSQLHQWKKDHLVFYKTISSTTTINQQLSSLTNLIQQAHFIIQQVSPTQALKNNRSDYTVTITATGNFIHFFSFMNTLTDFPIPFTLSTLLIDHHKFKMVFILHA